MALTRERLLVHLVEESDVYLATEWAGRMAGRAGFDRYDRSNIETATSEVSTNAFRYGGGGWVSIRVTPDDLTVAVTDAGPGIGNAPGRARGLGVGMSGAERLMGEMQVDRLDPGTRVTLRKRRAAVEPCTSEWAVDTVTRPKHGSPESGDRFTVIDVDDGILVVLVDGLGSGAGAATAAKAVIEGVERSDASMPLERLAQVAHQAARPTRGAVGSLTRISSRGERLEYAGVGDTGARNLGSGEILSSVHGVLGIDEPRAQVHTTRWEPGFRVLLWTDGVTVGDAQLRGLRRADVDELERLVQTAGLDTDDCLLVAVSSTRTGV